MTSRDLGGCRLGSIDVDVRLSEKRGLLPTRTFTERAYLLFGKEGFDAADKEQKQKTEKLN